MLPHVFESSDSFDPRILDPKRILVTGGCGFIGSHLIRSLLQRGHEVLNVDKLTYAASPDSLSDVSNDRNYQFLKIDICDSQRVEGAFGEFQPEVVMNLAAESHVDRSIECPDPFIHTNVLGTLCLLKAAHRIWPRNRADQSFRPRFMQISTDEVYGSLGLEDPPFTESSRYDPSSPYSASKAAGDLLALSWARTYGLPVIVTNCSNNFGPFQFPEKLIPVIITRAINLEPIPIYGSGENIRDWIYVQDHVSALIAILVLKNPEDRYNIGAGMEISNINLAKKICHILDELAPKHSGSSYLDQLQFVEDRIGHDFRYAINSDRLKGAINFKISSWEATLRETVSWYLNNGCFRSREGNLVEIV